MEEKLSFDISVHEEEMDNKKVFVVECTELGISDFGYTLEEAIENIKRAVSLLIEEFPEKKELLIKPEPLMVTRVFL